MNRCGRKRGKSMKFVFDDVEKEEKLIMNH
jgi:hypothetical protein